MNIFIETFTSPIGDITCVASSTHLLQVIIGANDFSEQEDCGNKITSLTIKQLTSYFNGESCKFDVPLTLDSRPFYQKVYHTLYHSNSQVISYKELAKLAGNQNATRACGSAMAKNKFPIIIPCHRVILSDGSIGNYAFGVKIKQQLLHHEQLNFFKKE